MPNFQSYLVPTLFIAFFAWRFLRFRKVKSQLPKLLAEGAVIVDVRSAGEFAQASNPQSINIPLGEIHSRSKELDPGKVIVLCCASGTRSGMAVGILKKNGFNRVMNAGSWMNTLI